MQSKVPAEFLADLDGVCPISDEKAIPSSFLADLEIALVDASVVSSHEPAVSVADLASLAESFDVWRRHYRQVLEQLLSRLPADDPLLSPVSLFGTIDYGRLETAHTRALAWLLGDREHGFGNALLEALLVHLAEGRTIRLTGVDRVESEFAVRCGPALADAGRIDVLAEGRWEESGKEAPWLVVIEAKIDAEEAEEQLAQYDAWLEQYGGATEVLRVFLTPDGRAPQTGAADWQPLSFLELAGVLRHASSQLVDRPGYHFLRYYLTGVLREVCELPFPITSDCTDPYSAVDYLKMVLGPEAAEENDGRHR